MLRKFNTEGGSIDIFNMLYGTWLCPFISKQIHAWVNNLFTVQDRPVDFSITV